MNRVLRAQGLEISLATAIFPEHLRRLLTTDVFCGDPVFAGIGRYTETASDGRSSRDTAHVCYPWHVYDRRTTVVLPRPIGLAHTVHELAHVLDWRLDFTVSTRPVTRYAQRNRYESFAEFVTAALVGGYLSWDPRRHSVLEQPSPLTLLGMLG